MIMQPEGIIEHLRTAIAWLAAFRESEEGHIISYSPVER
jgi:hypothetical protein